MYKELIQARNKHQPTSDTKFKQNPLCAAVSLLALSVVERNELQSQRVEEVRGKERIIKTREVSSP